MALIVTDKKWFSDVFRGYLKRPVAWNGWKQKWVNEKIKMEKTLFAYKINCTETNFYIWKGNINIDDLSKE